MIRLTLKCLQEENSVPGFTVYRYSWPAFGNSHKYERLFRKKKRRIYYTLVARTVAGLDGYCFFGKFYVPGKQLLFLGNTNYSDKLMPPYNKYRKGRNKF